jgi:hypothetical protein
LVVTVDMCSSRAHGEEKEDEKKELDPSSHRDCSMRLKRVGRRRQALAGPPLVNRRKTLHPFRDGTNPTAIRQQNSESSSMDWFYNISTDIHSIDTWIRTYISIKIYKYS